MRIRSVLVILTLAAGAATALAADPVIVGDRMAAPLPSAPIAFAPTESHSESSAVRAALATTTLPFLANDGQVDQRVAFYARTFAGTAFVTRTGEVVHALAGAAGGAGWTLTESFTGGRARPFAKTPGVTRVSSFRGVDPIAWRNDIKTHSEVGLGEVWPSVTVELAARGRNVEKIFTVAPGASAQRIRVRLQGADSLRIDEAGALVAATSFGDVVFTPPVAYQQVDGLRQTVDVRYALRGREYGFRLGRYDRRLPLIIDPLLQSTFLGGSAIENIGSIAIHPASGEIYVVGETRSIIFPGTAGGAQPGLNGDSDVFVARLEASLKTLVQATFIGGNSREGERSTSLSWPSIAIHPVSGDVYIAGATLSSDFPGKACGLPYSAFVARFDATLTTLVSATCLGGFGRDAVHGRVAIAIHPASGEIYVAGVTDAPDFPGVTGGAQPTKSGFFDLFVARLAVDDMPADDLELLQATYLGGNSWDDYADLAIHPTSGDVYVAARTLSTDLLHTQGAPQPACNGCPLANDIFVSRLNAALTMIHLTTYFGGSGGEQFPSVAVHPTTGDVYVAGETTSIDLPGRLGGAQAAYGGGLHDAFVARYNATLTSLLQSSYVGGSREDGFPVLLIRPATNEIYVAGETSSTNFPGTAGGAQPTNAGSYDTFVARFNAALTTRHQATYVGGNGTDTRPYLALHPTSGDIYLAGDTLFSTTFIGTAGGAQSSPAGDWDVFIARLTPSLASGPEPCAGFADVDVASPFCPNVEWLKNRQVTLGCAAGLYCPVDPVNRLAMAAFMNRFGTALSPVPLVAQSGPGALDLDVQTIACQTSVTFATYPRAIYVDAILNVAAAGDRSFELMPVRSTDGGATWQAISTQPQVAFVAGGHWASVRVIGTSAALGNQGQRFGLAVSRGAQAGTGDLADSRCRLRASVTNR